MIQKIDTLPKIVPKTMSLGRIFAADKAFSDSALKNDFWVQYDGDRLTSIISMSGGSMNIYCNGPDYGELSEFLSVLCPSEIFTELETAEKLSLIPIRVRNMLTYNSSGTNAENENIPLQKLYDSLSFGSDVDIHLPDFPVFAPDVSHRLRHSSATAVLKDYGAALAFTYDGGAVMTGIAISPEYRKKGLGKQLLLELLSKISGKFFVAANDQNKYFYLNSGFSLSGKVGYWRLV